MQIYPSFQRVKISKMPKRNSLRISRQFNVLMCKGEKCRKKLHTEFPKKSEKNEIISRNSLHGQNV